MPAGRPSEYSQDIVDEVCARLAVGQSMRKISTDEDMPCMTTLFKWLREHEEFAQQYARAKEESAEYLAEEMFDIADNGANDWMEQLSKEEQIGWKLNGEHIQRSRLRVDTRKWYLSKIKPKKYGDKIQTEHSGSVGLTDMTDEQLEKRINELLKNGGES